ncbi:hypothetical protein XM53_04405 [Roseovarius atlanticus]|uniref:Uncharacterized protein n=1 Tax=Roseovarius atlanticus TaxID=1641875 RepID=A0A0T5NY29_9RHOB|nr:hypothetical protein [Roseovarius atlanticus]KRS13816.1 hypothetical protein XM53_04405 [Roseovarius atlanticus]
MEALVLIFAEIILACMAPVIAILGAIVGAVIEGILLLFGGVFAEWVQARRARRASAKGKSSPPRKPLIPRKVVHWVAGGSAVLGVLGVVATYVFFQPILRLVIETASEKAGMSVEYAEASGSLLGGHVVLNGLEMARAHETGLAFDLAVARAEADVDLWSLLSDTPRLELGQVEGVEGYVIPPLPREEAAGEERGLPKPRRAFKADRLAVEGVDVEIRPRGTEPYTLAIETGEVAPFRSGLALFDLLFRSNLTAEVAGQPLVVETREITEQGRETRWAFEDVDAAQLKRLVPRAPLTWIETGRATVMVEDRWSLSEDFVDMNWRLAARDMAVSVPEGAARTERMLAGGLGKLVAAQGGNAEFRYQLQLDAEEMARLREGDIDLFWDTVLAGVMKGGIVREDQESEAPQEPEEHTEDKPGAIDRLKSFFEKDDPAD